MVQNEIDSLRFRRRKVGGSGSVVEVAVAFDSSRKNERLADRGPGIDLQVSAYAKQLNESSAQEQRVPENDRGAGCRRDVLCPGKDALTIDNNDDVSNFIQDVNVNSECAILAYILLWR